MREILFRGKRVDNGEWVYGLLCRVGNTYANIRRMDTEVLYSVLTNTIGQFTGLTDRNGKKIFEGDILAAPDYPNLKYKVSFANANFCVKCPAQPYLFYLGSRCFDMFGNPEYEIVGNVYDSDKEPFGNPELLGGESDG